MKISVIVTVFNERASIRSFVDGLLKQTRLPDEIIIVDAGSTDGTIEQLATLAKANSLLRYYIEKGCNVARGRNIAIQHSQFDCIAMTDAGSRVEPGWLAALVSPLEKDSSVDIVGGWVEYEAKTSFEEWLCLLNKPFEKIDFKNYLPSARSLALNKKCWESVGGFPEELSMWAEDTVFLQRLKEKNFRFAFIKEAPVCWRPRQNLMEFWKQYFEYGIGDGEARIYPMLYLKRAALLLSVVLFIAGFYIDAFISLFCIIFWMLVFIRLVIPLHRPGMSFLKLIPLFGLIMLMEHAQLAGYVIGRFRKRAIPR